MPINVHKSGGFTVTGPEGMNFYRMAALKGALSLEMKGLRVTRNFSAYATIKREFGLKGTRQSVYEQFCKLVDEQSSKVARVYEDELQGDQLAEEMMGEAEKTDYD
jgi:hypothetical protein